MPNPSPTFSMVHFAFVAMLVAGRAVLLERRAEGHREAGRFGRRQQFFRVGGALLAEPRAVVVGRRESALRLERSAPGFQSTFPGGSCAAHWHVGLRYGSRKHNEPGAASSGREPWRGCCLRPVVFLFGMPGTLLDDRFTEPRGETIAALRACPGDVVVLGAGGKMGPSLTAMLARAAKEVADKRRIVAVSRWSDREAKRALDELGVITVSCDLLDRSAVAELPDAPNVIFMAGQKFGTQNRPSLTWAMNTLVPTHAAERYAECADRRLLDRQRLSARPRRRRRCSRKRRARTDRRVRRVVPRPRTSLRAFFRAERNTGRALSSQLRDRRSLRRAPRPRAESDGRRFDSPGDGPCQRHLAGRCQPDRDRGAAARRIAALRRQRHRERDVVRARSRATLSGSASVASRSSRGTRVRTRSSATRR